MRTKGAETQTPHAQESESNRRDARSVQTPRVDGRSRQKSRDKLPDSFLQGISRRERGRNAYGKEYEAKTENASLGRNRRCEAQGVKTARVDGRSRHKSRGKYPNIFSEVRRSPKEPKMPMKCKERRTRNAWEGGICNRAARSVLTVGVG